MTADAAASGRAENDPPIVADPPVARITVAGEASPSAGEKHRVATEASERPDERASAQAAARPASVVDVAPERAAAVAEPDLAGALAGEAMPSAPAAKTPDAPAAAQAPEEPQEPARSAAQAGLRTVALLSAAHATARTPRPASRWRGLIGEDIEDEMRCLALNIYWEARSEPTLGRFAVAAVTLEPGRPQALPRYRVRCRSPG